LLLATEKWTKEKRERENQRTRRKRRVKEKCMEKCGGMRRANTSIGASSPHKHGTEITNPYTTKSHQTRLLKKLQDLLA
jgi:hypothetical protein